MSEARRMTRRTFNQSVSIAALASIGPAGCSSSEPVAGYDELIADTWRHTEPRVDGGPGLLRELVRYASLAANSHNTQPWLFELGTNRITVRPDYSRRCPAVDPDDHHLFASLGCAVENLVLAAQAHGLHAEVTLPGPQEDAIRIDLESSAAIDSPRFLAIPERQCTRAAYDGKPVAAEELGELEAAMREEGVSTQLFTDRKKLEEILEYVVAGNSAQMNDDAFVRELKDWLRFNEAALVEHRDGVFSASSGNPTLPNWVGSLVLRFAFTEKGENDKYRQQIRSSAGIVAFVSARNDKASWIRVGRSYQRFALESTALGLRHAFVNQAVEVPEVRTQFAEYLGIGEQRPDLLVRFGYGPLMPRSARRPLDQIVI